MQNAVAWMLAQLGPEAWRRLALVRRGRFDATPPVIGRPHGEALRAAVEARFAGDLVEFLNAAQRDELDQVAAAASVPALADLGALRAALWRWGAIREAGSDAWIGSPLQPEPWPVARGLVVHARADGVSAPGTQWPRPVPPLRAWAEAPLPPPPDDIDALLAAATAAMGVRLGARGRDKGAWGSRAARLLGLHDDNRSEPDWQGDVEVKTVAVMPSPEGRWLIAEDPAVAMRDASPLAKLQHVLWLVRAPLPSPWPADDATVIAWHLQAWSPRTATAVRRYLHQRPKGPAGTDGTAWYLHRRFFAETGLLAVLNGPSVHRRAP